MQHNGVFICDMYDSRHWESYQRDNVTFSCVDAPCGNINANATLEEGTDYECTDSDCSFTCSDGLIASPSSVTCDQTKPVRDSNQNFWEHNNVTISCFEADTTPDSDITMSAKTMNSDCQAGWELTNSSDGIF